MPRICRAASAWAVLAAVAPAAVAQQDPAATLTFERGGDSPAAAGWSGVPTGTLFLDSVVVHGGRLAGRIERDSLSEGDFSTFTLVLPRTFAGDSIVLRGWVRTQDVVGVAAIWMRQDGRSGPVQFATTQPLGVSGTTDWTEYRIALPLDRQMRSLALGALLAGRGRVWVDDLELLVDGSPAAEVAMAPVEPTVVDLDREFDGGSGIDQSPLTALQVRNLATLGRVWGFAKYHHPRVTTGGLHWDYELFRVMPEVLAATTSAEASEAIDEWLGGFGQTDRCERCPSPAADVHLPAELGWLDDTASLGTPLTARLRGIQQSRPWDGKQHYVGFVAGVGNPEFSSETAYSAALMNDAGYRLLALFRFWNIVEYWFPYRDLIEGSWEEALREFIPEVMAARDPAEFQLVMMRLIARVGDTHANLWSQLDLRPPRGTAQLPVSIRFIEGRAIVTGYSHAERGPATGLVPGDEIVAMDGMRIDSLVRGWEPYYAASNQPTRLRDIARTLTRGAPGAVGLSVSRDGVPLQLTAERAPQAELDQAAGRQHDLAGEAFQMLSDEVAYLKLSSVVAADAASYVERAAGAKVLVIDIRNYPSEFVVFALGGHLVSAPTAFARFTVADPANPGEFRFTPPVAIQPLTPRFSGKVVILVDEVSQSQAEYTAMALRSTPDAIVVGSTTAGADGNVSPIPLFVGMPALISGIGVFYPDRRPTQRIGIIPDLEVRPTVQGIREGRDEVLEAGVSRALGREFRLSR